MWFRRILALKNLFFQVKGDPAQTVILVFLTLKSNSHYHLLPEINFFAAKFIRSILFGFVIWYFLVLTLISLIRGNDNGKSWNNWWEWAL